MLQSVQQERERIMRRQSGGVSTMWQWIVVTYAASCCQLCLAGTNLGIYLDVRPVDGNPPQSYLMSPSSHAHMTSATFYGTEDVVQATQLVEARSKSKSLPISIVVSTSFEYAMAEEGIEEDLLYTFCPMDSYGRAQASDAQAGLALYLSYITEEVFAASKDTIQHIALVANKPSRDLYTEVFSLLVMRRDKRKMQRFQYSFVSPERAALMERIATNGPQAVVNTVFVQLGWTDTVVSLWRAMAIDDNLGKDHLVLVDDSLAMGEVDRNSVGFGLSGTVDRLFEHIIQQQGFEAATLTECEKGSIWTAGELLLRKMAAESSPNIEYKVPNRCGKGNVLSNSSSLVMDREEFETGLNQIFSGAEEVLADLA